jgi:hypothetical protein
LVGLFIDKSGTTTLPVKFAPSRFAFAFNSSFVARLSVEGIIISLQLAFFLPYNLLSLGASDIPPPWISILPAPNTL